MKKTVLFFLFLPYFTAPVNLQAIGPWEMFSLAFAMGTMPIAGHAITIHFLKVASEARDPKTKAIVMPGIVGLSAGTIFYVGLAESLKSLFPDIDKIEVYAYATAPAIVTLSLFWAREKFLHRYGLIQRTAFREMV